MLISFPYLPEYNPGNPRPWAEVKTMDHSELPLHGRYPVGEFGCWHGGVHLCQQTENQPLRAIADGTVVAYRHAPDKTDSGEDNSFILLRHETETGNGRPIRFYSLYMHLLDASATDQFSQERQNTIIPLMRQASELRIDGKTRVRRKDILGYCGKFSGLPIIHFEIFMTDADFQSYFQHTQLGNDSIRQNGDVEWWGDHYWIIPPGQPLYEPKSGAFAGTVEKRLFVRIRYEHGNKITTVWEDQGPTASPKRIICKTATHLLGDDEPDHKEIGYEYNLYDMALARYRACPSTGYELLRFGRSFGPDKEQLTAEQSCNLQPIAIAQNTLGYVDVSSADILKLSDADFPSFMGWARIAESDKAYADDGVCDVKAIIDAIKESRACTNNTRDTQERLMFHLGCPSVRTKLQGLICEAPSEWAQSTNTQRYARLLEPGEEFHNRNDEYEKFLRHIEQFQFWDQTGLPTKVWHFHPLAFIAHFQKCKWLSASELRQLFPKQATRLNSKKEWVTETVSAPNLTRPPWPERLAELNRAAQKFGITTPPRMAAFYGNALQETQWLNLMREGGNNTGNRGARYYPWDGRGYLQLTWPANYIKYWEFRGIQIDAKVKKGLNDAADKTNVIRTNAPLDDQEKTLPKFIVDLREDIVDPKDKNKEQESHYNLANTAGAYWAWSRAAESADEDAKNIRKTVAGTNDTFVYYEHLSFGNVAATVNVGERNSNFAKINGLQARFQAFTAAQVILFDCPLFPQQDKSEKPLPEPVVLTRRKS